MATPNHLKTLVLDRAREYFDQHFSQIPKHKGCLQWALCCKRALSDKGMESTILAGSAHFPLTDLDKSSDGGIDFLTFKWESKWSEESLAAFIEGKGLPEIHCWVYVKDNMEFVDLSQPFMMEAHKAMGTPIVDEYDETLYKDDFYWAPATNAPGPRTPRYEPEEDATMFISGLVYRCVVCGNIPSEFIR